MLELRGRVCRVSMRRWEGEKCSHDSEGVVGPSLNCAADGQWPAPLLNVHISKVPGHQLEMHL